MTDRSNRWGGTPVPQPPDVPRRADDEPPGFFDNPATVRKLKIASVASVVVLVALDFFLHAHEVLGPEDFPGYFFVLGFVASVVLILVSKGLGKGLKREPGHDDVAADRDERGVPHG